MSLRVAHLIESDGPGGAERVMAYLATAFHEAGHHSVAFLPAGGEGWLGAELERAGVPIEYFRLPQPVSREFGRWLTDAFRRHRITVAHSHEFTMAVYGAWASWRGGARHVITMHGSRYYAGRLQRRVAMRAAIALSARTAAVSRDLQTHLSRDLWVRRSQLSVIANGVRYTPPAPDDVTLREELRLAPRDRLLLAVGNLYPVKGHRYLVEALALLHRRHPLAHVAIAGRGEEGDALMSRARALGIADHVHLLGLRSDIPALLAAADISVLPSLSEGLPMALLEAMFAARPIVASQVGEVGTALAAGEAGLLVPPGDPAALADALDRLLSDAALARQLGERAARRAAAEYGLATMVDRYTECYTGASKDATRPTTSR
jgi:glycosyltransferase involved in cell wall biosynthesis